MTEFEKRCLNCHHPLRESELYCPHCGQKTNVRLLSIADFFRETWESVFNLDNTFFRTMRYIPMPWVLTKFYVSGKRRSFFHPIRFFIITLLFHFGFLVSLSNIDNRKVRSVNEYNELEKSKLYQKYLDTKGTMAMSQDQCIFADSIEHILFQHVNTPEKDTFFVENLFNIERYAITRNDAIELDIDSIYTKYEITSFVDKLLVKQMIRLNLDRAGMIRYGIGNAAWGVLLAIIALAFFLKLLYIRKRLPYVEHFVLLLYVHSLCFIIVSILLLMAFKAGLSESTADACIPFIFIIPPVILYLSFKKYYQQGYFKTFLKFVLASGFYLFIGLLLIIFVSVGSLIFF